MGRWIPNSGTMYRTLIDQCIELFGIHEIPADDAFMCYGDPGGYNCNCVWKNDGFIFCIRTPQFLERKKLPRNLLELRNWLFNGRYWKQTTGFLTVSRLVRVSSPHFEWIDVMSIAHGFRISASPIEIDLATTNLKELTTRSDWFSPQLRHDGAYEFVLTSPADPRAVRFTSLFRNEKGHVVIGQVLNVVGLGYLYYKPGYLIGDMVVQVSNMSEAERCEFLTYEFELAGKSSYDFSVA